MKLFTYMKAYHATLLKEFLFLFQSEKKYLFLGPTLHRGIEGPLYPTRFLYQRINRAVEKRVDEQVAIVIFTTLTDP